MFTTDWYGDHIDAWHVAGIIESAWDRYNWFAVRIWVANHGSASDQPHAITATADEGNETTRAAYGKSIELVNSGRVADAKNARWMPLGVFGVVDLSTEQFLYTLQLAVSTGGNIRDTQGDMAANSYSDVYGAVGRQTWHVAWKADGDNMPVFSTYLDYLTLDVAPVVIRFGEEPRDKQLILRMARKDAL